MDPLSQFCPNFYCLHRGRTGKGNLRVHSRQQRRFRCATCGKTFAATKNTPSYRLHHSLDLGTIVLTLLCHGCPRQAVVAAYGLDERTVADWELRAGRHSQRFHELQVQQGKVEVQHVQADALWVKMVSRKVWMALALAVPSRLWLGGVLSRQRDGRLLTALVQQIRRCAQSLGLLACVDGLSRYVTAFLRVVRHKVQGKRGRPRLVVEPGLLIGQLVKQYSGRRRVGVTRRAVRGSVEAIAVVRARTGTGTGINTAYSERWNATFRSRLTALVRRGRALLHEQERLQAAMFLVGCVYNFCWAHDSLRQRAAAGARRRWQERTLAMAAGLSDHRWEIRELLSYRVTPERWKAPRRRLGRRRRSPAAGPLPLAG
jgi:transposase-like protein